jgi:hypothetical protein
MSTDERIVLRLEVDREADPITGTLAQPGHAERPFIGWLALTNEIESIRAAAVAAGPRSDVDDQTAGGF